MTETTTRTEDAASPVARVGTALTGLISDFKAMQAELETKLTQQEERLTMLNRPLAATRRPHLSTATETEAPHQKAFAAYLRNGDDDGLRGLELDGKAMSRAVNSDGGYLVDPQTADQIHSALRAGGSLRSIANVVQVEATSYDVLVDHADMGAGWVSESGSVSETGTPQIDRISIPLFELNALPKASQRLLDDSAFDVETWLADRIADKFMRAEAAAFVTGDGADKPTGFLSHGTAENGSWSWGSLGYVASGEAADLDATGETLVDLVYALGAEYRAKAVFVMNSKTAGTVRKITGADGRYLWADSLTAGEPARLLGYPVVIAEDMPDVGANETPIAFGDFRAGYTIAERPDLRILRDPFSAKPHVLFYATKRVGGDVTDFAAIKMLKIATS